MFPTPFPPQFGLVVTPRPVVHGLWPQNGNFGTSECGKADNVADPRRIYPCTFGCKKKQISLSFLVVKTMGGCKESEFGWMDDFIYICNY